MEGKCKEIATLFKDYFEADVDRGTSYLRHQGEKCKHFDVSDVIYHKFSHGTVFVRSMGKTLTSC